MHTAAAREIEAFLHHLKRADNLEAVIDRMLDELSDEQRIDLVGKLAAIRACAADVTAKCGHIDDGVVPLAIYRE